MRSFAFALPLVAVALHAGCGLFVIDTTPGEGSGGSDSSSGPGGSGGGGATGTFSTSQSSSGAGGSLPCPSAWMHQLGGPSTQFTRDVDAGPDGAVAVTYQFYGSLSLDGAPIATSSGFAADVGVARFDPSGAYQWSRTFGVQSTQNEYVPLAISPTGTLVVGTGAAAPFDLGDGLTLDPQGGSAVIIALSPDGHPLWARAFPSTWTGARVAHVAVDAAGEVVFTGGVDGFTIDFGEGPVSSGPFVAKLAADGTFLWARFFEGIDLERRSLAVRPTGEVILAGSFYGAEIDLGGGPLPGAGGSDLFLVELGADGEHLHSHTWGDPGLQRSIAVTAAPDGDILFTGIFSGTLDLGGAPLEGEPYSAFLARLTPSGDHVWSRAYPENSSISSLAVAPSGAILAAGTFHGDLGPDCAPPAPAFPAGTASLLHLSPGGDCLSPFPVGLDFYPFLTRAVPAGEGRVAFTFGYSGVAPFDDDPLVTDGTDAFVAARPLLCDPD